MLPYGVCGLSYLFSRFFFAHCSQWLPTVNYFRSKDVQILDSALFLVWYGFVVVVAAVVDLVVVVVGLLHLT